MSQIIFQKPTKLQALTGKLATAIYKYAYIYFAAVGNFVVKKFKVKQKVAAKFNANQ